MPLLNVTNKRYAVVPAKSEELPIMIDLAAQEGWNPGLHDAECFYQADPTGFFLGKLAEEIIAVGSGVKYQHEFAFFGLYIVKPAYRGQGYGLTLTQAIFSSIENMNTGLDGVPQMQHQYAKFGFKLAHYNSRYEGKVQRKLNQNPFIVDLSQVAFDSLLAFDRDYFPAERSNFLKKWISQPDSRALGYWVDGKLLGYGIIRRCLQGFKIGPLFAHSSEIAYELFVALALHAKGQNIFLDVIDDNKNAVSLASQFGFQKVFSTARMYTKKIPDINISHIYGITSFELG